MIPATTRPLAAAAAICLGLFAPGTAPAATGQAPTRLENAIIRTALVPEPGLDYARWPAWTLDGGAAATPDVGPDNQPLLAVPAGGSASQTLRVPRGGIAGKGRRYLVTTRFKREGAGISARLAVASSGGSSTGTAVTTGVWETVSAFADTAHWLPGRDTDNLSIRLEAAGEGRLLCTAVQIDEIPCYGIFFRFKVLAPAAGAFQAAAGIIRRHRDKGHRDPVRQRYFSRMADLGGVQGVASSRFSPWIDMRRHLFGSGLATVGLLIHPAGAPQSPVPVRVAVELAYFVDDGIKATDESRRGGPADWQKRDETPGVAVAVLDEMIGEIMNDPPIETAHLFYRTERTTENGVLGFLLPENEVPPERFITSVVCLEEDVERRAHWLDALPAPAKTASQRIMIGANFFTVNGLVSPGAARLEADLLVRIGIRASSDAGFVQARRAYYGSGAPVSFHYARLEAEAWGRSPYDGPALEQHLAEKYRAFAAGLTNRAALAYVELLDEPGNVAPTAVDQPAFRNFLKRQGATPALVGAADWSGVETFGLVIAPTNTLPRPEAPDLPPVGTAGEAALDLREDPDFDDGAAREGLAAPEANRALPLEQRRLLYYTRVFAAHKTADLLATATRAVHTHIPDARTLVNFRSGVRQVLTAETADWFTIGRQRAVDVMWNEDWVNTYGWRRDGIQSVSYYTELMRAAARKHDLPVGGFLMCYWGQAERKAWSALAHGSRFIHFWRYGPHYANYLPYSWSGSSNTVMAIARFCRDVETLEPTLADARRDPARVALLYAKADPIWGRGQTEHRMLFFALLHDQIPVDLLTEADIADDGLLDNYDFLYIGDVAVQRTAQQKIAEWVGRGGNLWLSAGAATRDEFDEPSAAIPAERLAPSGDGAPAQAFRQVGKGLVCVNATQPGLHYLETVVRERGRLQRGWEAARRKWITGFALDNGLMRPVEADIPCVEAVLYRHPREDIVMLINYVGADPLSAVTLTVQGTAKVRAVESLRHGPLTYEQTATGVRVSLPLAQGDAVRLHRE